MTDGARWRGVDVDGDMSTSECTFQSPDIGSIRRKCKQGEMYVSVGTTRIDLEQPGVFQSGFLGGLEGVNPEEYSWKVTMSLSMPL